MQTDRKLLVTPIATPKMPNLPFSRSHNNFTVDRENELQAELTRRRSEYPVHNTQLNTNQGPENSFDDMPFPDLISPGRNDLQNKAAVQDHLLNDPDRDLDDNNYDMGPAFNQSVDGPIISLGKEEIAEEGMPGMGGSNVNRPNRPFSPPKHIRSNHKNTTQQFEGGEFDTQAPMIDEKMDNLIAQKNLKRQMLIEEKQEQARAIKDLAKTNVEIADSVQKPARIRTLYYGLKVNTERNVAVVHPLMFLIRRVIYALVIVFMDEIPLWGVLIFMTCTLIMLAYALSEL